MHIYPSNNMVIPSLKFASVHIRNLVLRSVEAVNHDQVTQWVKSATNAAEAAGLRGELFEPLAHEELMRGGKFKFHFLVNKEEEAAPDQTVTFPELENGQFKEMPSQPLAYGCYYYPTWKTLETGDAFSICDFLGKKTFVIFQMTVSSSHDIKRAGLMRLLEYNTQGLPVMFCFVVPEDIFSKWKQAVVVKEDKEANAKKEDEKSEEETHSSSVTTSGMREAKRVPKMEQGVLVVTLSGCQQP
jgi:hypothetical protein